jgi:hypothetical protein
MTRCGMRTQSAEGASALLLVASQLPGMHLCRALAGFMQHLDAHPNLNPTSNPTPIPILGPPIHHFDLYRLEPGPGMGRLDLGTSFSSAVCLVEWPERLAAGDVPQQRLELRIDIVGEVSAGFRKGSRAGRALGMQLTAFVGQQAQTLHAGTAMVHGATAT